MNRRDALVTIGLTTLSGVTLSMTMPPLLQATRTQASLATPDTPAEQALDDRLRQDEALLGSRVNSEEGIGMFLACENLVPDKLSHEPPKPVLTPLNAALSSAMHRNAEAWLRIRPDAKYKDVAQVIEVLAYRDLSHGAALEQL